MRGFASRHREQVRETVASRRLVSCMNDTKWLELQRAILDELPFPPPYQRKDVLSDTPEPPRFDADVWYHGDWVEGILPFYSIEWVSVRPRYLRKNGALLQPEVIDCAEDLKRILARHQIPFKIADDCIVIVGYDLPGSGSR